MVEAFPRSTQERGPDEFLYLKQSIELTSNGRKLEFRSGAAANLLFHTLNIYGLLGMHGRSYAKKNEKIGDAPDAGIQEKLMTDWYQNEEVIVRAFVDIDPRTPGELIEKFSESGEEILHPFSEALRDSWQKYENYWNASAPALHEKLQTNIDTAPWREWARKMEAATGATFDTDMLSINAEPLMESAMYLKPNVCIGAIRSKGDGGFVHEGLHLLLKEKWAEDPRIKELETDGWHDDFWEDNWKGMFEQAIVVSLDHLIRNDQQPIGDYFQGCMVGGLTQYFYEPIKRWYQLKTSGQTQETLTDVISNILVTHKAEIFN